MAGPLAPSRHVHKTDHPFTLPSGANLILIHDVGELIDPVTGSWDTQLVHDIFLGGGCQNYFGNSSLWGNGELGCVVL
jgi:hypothetical protein